MAVVKRDNAEFYLCQENYQQLGQPMNIRIMVDNIEEFYQECLTHKAIEPETKIQLQPWGTKEIEIIAPMSVHLVFYTLVDS